MLRLSDLPTFRFEQPQDTRHQSSSVLRNSTSDGDVCSHMKSCFKCTDRDECGWCTKEGVDVNSAFFFFVLFFNFFFFQKSHTQGGSCVMLKNKAAACESNGGKVGECPFFSLELGLTTGLIAVCALLSAGGGIGGGALFIPIYLIVYGLTAHQAVPLSKITIFGLAIGGFTVLYSKRHPYKDAPLIDYDLTMLLIPGILLGTIAGVYLNVIFPAFVIVISLVVLLTYTSYKTWRKSFQLYKEETEGNKKAEGTEMVQLDQYGDPLKDEQVCFSSCVKVFDFPEMHDN
jgi:hypothetical protein